MRDRVKLPEQEQQQEQQFTDYKDREADSRSKIGVKSPYTFLKFENRGELVTRGQKAIKIMITCTSLLLN